MMRGTITYRGNKIFNSIPPEQAVIRLEPDQRTIDVDLVKDSMWLQAYELWGFRECGNLILQLKHEYRYRHWWQAWRYYCLPEYTIRTMDNMCVGEYKRRPWEQCEFWAYGDRYDTEKRWEGHLLHYIGQDFTTTIASRGDSTFSVSDAKLLLPVMGWAFLVWHSSKDTGGGG